MRHRLYALAMSCCLAAGATVTASCGGCDKDNIQVSISPGQDVIRVGQSTFAPRVGIVGCGGTQPLGDTYTWRSSDATIIRVDANTGVATGLRAGVAEAIVTGKRYGELGSVTITVQGS